MKFRKSSREKPTGNEVGSDSVGTWVAIGLCFGVTVGALIDNVGLGISLGICFGAAIGSVMSRKTDEAITRKQPGERNVSHDD